MKIKRENNYFDMMSNLVDYSCCASALLNDALINFRKVNLKDKISAMHNIEHTADLKKHDLINNLAKEFVTPIERGDILELSHQIDNVTDAIEDVLVRIHIFNISSVRKEALNFCDIIIRSCNELKKLMYDFHNFKKSKDIHTYIININALEEEGDRLYMESMITLYRTSKNPIEIMTWQHIFEDFEKCCDAAEHAADVVESVIMKNI